jgi:hypothetical protein
LNGHGVDEFATLDNDILEGAKGIEKLTNIHIIEP